MDREDTEERALCLDADTRLRVEHRLNRLAGQIEGIRRMVGEERGCAEILPQIASIKQAVNGLAGELLQAHISESVRRSESGDQEQVIEKIQGVVKSVVKHS